MATRRYALITFDLDDTLWDVAPVLARAEQRVEQWMRVHCPRVPERFDRAALMDLRRRLHRERPDLQHRISELRIEAMRLALLAAGHDEASARRLAARAFAVFMEGRHDIEPFAGVDTVLDRLARHYVLGALTNGNADVFRLPLGRHFRFAFSAEALGASKPAPGHFEAALRAADVTPGRALHVGDHLEHDVLGARRAGMTAVWFNRAGREHEGNEPAHAEFRDFEELPALIERLEREEG
ncbi:MAG: HAD family hydrolase [Gammaproteobacteria bacterium]|nr:HAD family hydrolase [Gammaproteobacteria bacterium]MBK8992352.1 HAD family hydrolase [Gammaproteobacteria bacterium]MBP6480235.1 HAD family hydrolase [Pseudomonadales bacterium]MBP7909326.1 HAD family hydrolase [Pseudomonadales bacterium]